MSVNASTSTGPMMLPPGIKHFRALGAGRKHTLPEVREAMYEWFIDIRGSLKGRLPKDMFKAQCQVFYDQWLAQQDEDVPEGKKIVFSNNWIKWWMKEYGVSLRKPNKRFQIKQEDIIERIKEYILNVWMVRKYFIDTYGVDPPVINGDQMPLHRNESSGQKTMSFTGQHVFVKENYMLSRERITAYTQVCSDTSLKFKPEFVFKGKGARTHLNPPDGVKIHWSPKGSYRLEQMLETIANLPNCHNIFTAKNYAVYVSDDYSVHLMPEVKAALLKRGYIYVGIGGGITGDIQINDTDVHAPLKAKYRQLEMELMLRQLQSDPKKIPSPSRDEMMSMLNESFSALDIDFCTRFKSLWVTNALDGSEDHMVSDKLFRLVGEDLVKYRNQLLKKPSGLKEMIANIIPPKGIKRKAATASEIPVDEGIELHDCEGDAAFLDDFEVFFNKHNSKTSTPFLPFMHQFQKTYKSARRSVKKRMRKRQAEENCLSEKISTKPEQCRVRCESKASKTFNIKEPFMVLLAAVQELQNALQQKRKNDKEQDGVSETKLVARLRGAKQDRLATESIQAAIEQSETFVTGKEIAGKDCSKAAWGCLLRQAVQM
eukprot:gene13649-15078_t